MSKNAARLVGINKAKQKESSVEPQEKKVFLEICVSYPTQAVGILFSQEALTESHSFKGGNASSPAVAKWVCPPSPSTGSRGSCVLVWGLFSFSLKPRLPHVIGQNLLSCVI